MYFILIFLCQFIELIVNFHFFFFFSTKNIDITIVIVYLLDFIIFYYSLKIISIEFKYNFEISINNISNLKFSFWRRDIEGYKVNKTYNLLLEAYLKI